MQEVPEVSEDSILAKGSAPLDIYFTPLLNSPCKSDNLYAGFLPPP